MRNGKKYMKLTAVGAAVLALTLAGCGSNGTTTTAAAPASGTAKQTQTVAAKPPVVHLYMDIMTGKMINKKGWPMISPADFKVPAGATIDLTIRNFDDGTAALPQDAAKYAKVAGTNNNNEKVNGKEITSLNPKDVSHTITFTQLGINIPIPVTSTTEVTFKAPDKPGTYAWQCLAPCGTGKTGMQGPMVTNGYMVGNMTVQ
ncbi:hypothetical protein LSG31_03205 [Fodinisporobacter ferrooxydans]|uniref:EfeO-type cupredoxin-like domain-containing protein n=1 Tax=Fodinisporobacter ferrooxydans TaxID=2901836 RepID=A0ABY4CLE0_9BACL|nr:hypothetical protein LSG31_03205 [Alicyclobacillaceae bacterium MYW30-H2]